MSEVLNLGFDGYAGLDVAAHFDGDSGGLKSADDATLDIGRG